MFPFLVAHLTKNTCDTGFARWAGQVNEATSVQQWLDRFN